MGMYLGCIWLVRGCNLDGCPHCRSTTWERASRAVLDELGYNCRRYRGTNPHATVKTWARLSLEKYPGRVLLVRVKEHVVVVSDGRVYDSWSPHGPSGDEHPFATARATHVYLVEKRSVCLDSALHR